ncbi:MAG: hypothetical protein WC496_01255 [Phycisphaerae bacterium]|jgi:hypothetical protein
MLINEGINKVRAFVLAGGTAVVKWHSTYDDKLYQVYVNGRFAGATIEPMQREIVVAIPFSVMTAARIEVFAVEPEFADTDFSNEVESGQKQTGRVKLELPRTDDLPMGGEVNFYLEGNRLNNRSIKILPEFADKGGFGLSGFGSSDFGYDGSAAIGLGKGVFGIGWFGFDADMLNWQSGQLQAGRYKFEIEITDSFGNTVGERIETETIIVIPPARPAERLTVKSFDRQSGKLILQVE